MQFTDNDMTRMERDIALFGVAYRYRVKSLGTYEWLDPACVVTYTREDNGDLALSKVLPPKPPGRFKRLIRHMTSLNRICAGIVVSWPIAWLANHHQVTEIAYWSTLGTWFVAMLLVFCLDELRTWARRSG